MRPVFVSTKTYPHSTGLSAAFRQWRAESHCRFLHGYAVEVRVEFRASILDERHWVVDFGGLKSFKGLLEESLDHKTVVAEDDPCLEWFKEGERLGTLQLIVVPACGMEALAELIFNTADCWLMDNGYKPRVKVHRVEVSEHGGNSAIYWEEKASDPSP